MFTGIYGFIFCDPKVINSSITSINTSLNKYHALYPVDILIANTNLISKYAGNAYCFYLANSYVALFFTLEFLTSETRSEKTSICRFRVGTKIANIQQPYNIPCIVNRDSNMTFTHLSITETQGSFISVPANKTWQANNYCWFSGAVFAELKSYPS